MPACLLCCVRCLATKKLKKRAKKQFGTSNPLKLVKKTKKVLKNGGNVNDIVNIGQLKALAARLPGDDKAESEAEDDGPQPLIPPVVLNMELEDIYGSNVLEADGLLQMLNEQLKMARRTRNKKLAKSIKRHLARVEYAVAHERQIPLDKYIQIVQLFPNLHKQQRLEAYKEYEEAKAQKSPSCVSATSANTDVKRLRRKLKEITDLKKKAQHGKLLVHYQLKRIQREDEIREMLEELGEHPASLTQQDTDVTELASRGDSDVTGHSSHPDTEPSVSSRSSVEESSMGHGSESGSEFNSSGSGKTHV